MPLHIIRQDITTLACDAIVCPTDEIFSGSGGADLAIHTAAGPQLAEACSRLPRLDQSDIAVTDGFGLPCRYVLHTMGPVWTGGGQHEEALLRACYVNAMIKASQLKLQSIAFPLISSGTFGFPRDKVLAIAQEAIGSFLSLREEEPEVILCIHDRNSYEVRLQDELDRFLRRGQRLFASSRRNTAPAQEEDSLRFSAAMPIMAMEMADETVDEAPVPKCRPSRNEVVSSLEKAAAPSPKGMDLSDWLKHQDDTFAVTLLKLIDQKGMDEVACYKGANVSKNTFYKINNKADYKPSKQTVVAFAISLKLDLAETKALLKTVGFTLSRSSTFDMIIEFCITNGIYNIHDVNAALYKYDQVCLGC